MLVHVAASLKNLSSMALGEGSRQHPPTSVRSLVAMYEGAASMSCASGASQATEVAMILARPFRGLRVGLSGLLLPTFDPSSPTCPTSCHNKIGNEPFSYNRSAIRASTGCIFVCNTVESAETPCSSPTHTSSAASSVPDSPLCIFQSSDYPYAASADASFLSSYQDLNCTRVAAFADVAAAPSLLASCKNGAFSPRPPPFCLTSRGTSPRGSIQQDLDDACSSHSSVRLALLHIH
jgi:hypothetical protein